MQVFIEEVHVFEDGRLEVRFRLPGSSGVSSAKVLLPPGDLTEEGLKDIVRFCILEVAPIRKRAKVAWDYNKKHLDLGEVEGWLEDQKEA